MHFVEFIEQYVTNNSLIGTEYEVILYIMAFFSFMMILQFFLNFGGSIVNYVSGNKK